MAGRETAVAKIAWCTAATSRPPASAYRRRAATPGKTSNSILGRNRNRLAAAARFSRSTASVPGTVILRANAPRSRRRHHKIDNRRIVSYKIDNHEPVQRRDFIAECKTAGRGFIFGGRRRNLAGDQPRTGKSFAATATGRSLVRRAARR